MWIKKGTCYLCGEKVWANCNHCNNFVPTKSLRQGFITCSQKDTEQKTKVSIALCTHCEKELTEFGMQSIMKNLQEGGEATQCLVDQPMVYEKWEEVTGKQGFWEVSRL